MKESNQLNLLNADSHCSISEPFLTASGLILTELGVSLICFLGKRDYTYPALDSSLEYLRDLARQPFESLNGH